MALKVGMQKSEIEKELAGKGTFVQIDWLQKYLQESLTMDMKKFVYQKLADIYEKTNMTKEGAKMYDGMANLSITFNEKIKHYMREIEMYVRAGDASGGEEAMKKALAQANSIQREEIYSKTIALFKMQAESYANGMKRSLAAALYEKLLQMRIHEVDRQEIRKKLLELYEKLGKRKEFHMLEKR